MKVRVDKTRCIGCAVCENICPEGIRMVEEKAEIKDENAGCLKDAANECPQEAILFDELTSKSKIVKTFNQNYRQGRRMGQGRGMGAGRGRGLGIGPRDGRGGGHGGGGRGRW